MTKEEKLSRLCEIFERSHLSPDTKLDELAWDSMAKLTIIAMARNAGQVLDMARLEHASSVDDLLDLI